VIVVRDPNLRIGVPVIAMSTTRLGAARALYYRAKTMPRTWPLIGITLTPAAFAVAVGGAALAASPTYLAAMPSVAQVELAIRGSDPVDTAVRQSEAFGQLCAAMRVIGHAGSMVARLTPDEQAQCAVYSRAQQALSAPFKLPSYGPTSWVMRQQKYHNDSFRGDVLDAFPDVKKLYNAGADQGSDADSAADPKRQIRTNALITSGGALGIGGLGLFLMIAGFRTSLAQRRRWTEVRRQEFERRTAAGIGFATFEDAERHRLNKVDIGRGTSAGYGMLGCGLLLLCVAFVCAWLAILYVPRALS
jgi:hypothetical protein